MNLNGYQGQIAACYQPDFCFREEQNLMPLIIQDSKWKNDSNKHVYIERIGIQAQPGTVVFVSNSLQDGSGSESQEIKIGLTGIYEANDVRIDQISFDKDTSYDVIIDYILNYDINEGV